MALAHHKAFSAPDQRPANRNVRPASAPDVREIVEIHEQAFRRFFLTQMGREFLRHYYELVLEYHSGIVLVAEIDSRIQGFACGFVNPADFYRLMRRNLSHFLLPALGALVRNPSLLMGIVRGAERVQKKASRDSADEGELSSIAVLPNAERGGLGSELARAFLSKAWSMEAARVCLSTDAFGNEAANSFYLRAGFQRTRQFLQDKGRWMNEYRIGRFDDLQNRK